MPETLLLVGFAVCGAFTAVLGLVHVVVPWLFDFDGAILTDGPALEPMAVGPGHLRDSSPDSAASLRSRTTPRATCW